MKKIILVLSLALSFFSYAEEVTLINVDGVAFIAPLPLGYCNATENLVGEIMIEYMELQNKNMNYTMPRVKKVFTRCGYEDAVNDLYPWGWIGIIKSPDEISQPELNRLFQGLEKDTDFLKGISEKGSKATEEALSELGFDDAVIKALSPGETAHLWSDSNVVIITTVNRGIIEGEFFEEKILGGFTAIDDVLFYYYITDELNGKSKTKENIIKLINNAELLSEYNK